MMDSLLSKVTPPLLSFSKTATATSTAAEHEIFLTDPSQLEDLETWCHQQLKQQQQQNQQQQNQPRIHLRLAQRLFGPPRISLSWKQRCHLFQLMGSKIPNLTSITIHGTTMGQVISAELLSTGIPSTLISLTMETGLIFDEPSSVQKLATALQHHSHLQHLQLYNFLNHVRPIQVPPTWLLDPLLYALGTCPQLQTLELACLASFLEWKVPLLSCHAIQFLLTHTPYLKKLQFTNLGLTDAEFSTLAERIPPLSSLQQVLVNGNENTLLGLRRLVLQCLSLGSTITHLEVMNHVKLTEDLYDYIVWYTEQYSCPLQWFEVTFPLRLDPSLLRLQLRLHQLPLAQKYYSPLATTTSQLQVLAQVSDDPNCLYRLLQQQPNLLQGRSKKPTPLLPTKTTTTTLTNHHNMNHDDTIDDEEDGQLATNGCQTNVPPRHHSTTMWTWTVNTASSSTMSMGLVTIFLVVLLFVVVPGTGRPKKDHVHGRPCSMVDDKDPFLDWAEPIPSEDSFPWNHSNQQCLTATIYPNIVH